MHEFLRRLAVTARAQRVHLDFSGHVLLLAFDEPNLTTIDENGNGEF
jgi:hypothetical protein